MKKNLFYVIGSCSLALISIISSNAQIANQPQLKSMAASEAGIEKSTSKVSADLNILYKSRGMEKKAASKPRIGLTGIGTGLQKQIQTQGEKVLIDITLHDNNSQTKAELEKIGFKILGAYGRVVSGMIPIEAISKLEAIQNIRFARPSYKPHHQVKKLSSFTNEEAGKNSITPVISQGDTAQRSYIARAKSKVNGKGVKVGILSDSYNNLGTANIGVKNGELPGSGNPFGFNKPVQVLEDFKRGGTDEGRGMAEIVHDVAPGAEMAFHTAFNGQADFAQGIIDLADAGCKVINDDVFYYAEPFFQDGIIAQAVDAVKKRGVTYFSAAGNQSRQSYESKFRGSTYSPLGTKFGTAHNFSSSANSPTYYQPITIPTNGYTIFDLQWADPFYSAGGAGAKTDLDIYLIDSEGRIVSFGTEDNTESGDPIELFDYSNNTNSTQFYVLITKFSGPDPSNLKYIYYGDGSLNSLIPGNRAATLVGHAKAKGAIATGAVWWKQTPAYFSDTPRIETFSSVGGVPNYFNVDGKRINPVERKKPEITAPDGGNTSFFGYDLSISDTDTFPNFFGTSAAAPHAAGVAALMIEAQKLNTITPDQIKGVLTDNATDMNDRYNPGFEKGFDYNTGYGFIQADKAVAAVKFPNVYLKDLDVEAVCSDNPSKTRNWKIINPNSFEVEVHWLLAGSDQSGNFTVPAGEKTFSTNTAYYMNSPVPNVVVIDWKDNLKTTHIDAAYSITSKCGESIVAEKNSNNTLPNSTNAKTAEKPNTVEVYPNPATKNFNVYLSLAKSENADISLYSSDGRLLYQRTSQTNGVISIDAASYKPGIYVLKVRQGAFSKTLKLIKQ